MKTAPNVDGLVETLGRVGMSMPPDVALEMLGWVGLIISGGVAGFFLLMKVRAEKRTYSLADLLGRLDKQDQEIASMRKDLDDLRTENRELRDAKRDSDELVEDLTIYVIDTDAHAALGWAPPPPQKTWRLQKRLAQWQATRHAAEKEDA